jgi:hypothetical protein
MWNVAAIMSIKESCSRWAWLHEAERSVKRMHHCMFTLTCNCGEGDQQEELPSISSTTAAESQKGSPPTPDPRDVKGFRVSGDGIINDHRSGYQLRGRVNDVARVTQ